MKRSIFFLLPLVACFFSMITLAQSILGDSKPFITPFQSIDAPALKKHIKSIAKDARIVGLGEVSHYTKECYKLKHEIIKQLIEEGYDGLILEVDFGQALIWNDYVNNGVGNLDSIVASSGWFTYRTEEFKNLLEAIRQHNLSAAESFQVFGMEMTAIGDNVKWLINYLNRNLPEEQELLTNLKKERKTIAFQEYTPEESQAYWKLHQVLSQLLVMKQEQLKSSDSQRNYQIASQIVEIFRQFATFISHDDFSLKVEFRDQFSARNVLWALDYLGEGSQCAIWAHNGHVAKQSILFNYDVLGHYLSRWFEGAYYSIGFTFNSGDFGAFSSEGFKQWSFPKLKTSSLTKEFAALQTPFLLFNINKNLASDKRSNSPLRSAQVIRRDISESYKPDSESTMRITLSQTYDLLIYIDHTSYPTTIPWIR